MSTSGTRAVNREIREVGPLERRKAHSPLTAATTSPTDAPKRTS